MNITPDQMAECEEIADLLLEGNKPMASENFQTLAAGLARDEINALKLAIDNICKQKTGDLQS